MGPRRARVIVALALWAAASSAQAQPSPPLLREPAGGGAGVQRVVMVTPKAAAALSEPLKK